MKEKGTPPGLSLVGRALRTAAESEMDTGDQSLDRSGV